MDEFEPAPLPTAYYRDVYVGVEAELSVLGPVASETWRVDWLKPDGTTLQSTVQFFSSYNGKQNCFVGSSQIACGGTTTRIYWYTAARCQPTSNYTVSFFDNDVQYDQREFKLLPQIQDGKVPRYDQTLALELNANFKGSAQNTKVNSLLSYNAPTQSQNKLPAGTTSYTVSIFYSGKIIPTTFHAELNGVDVSPSFHPIPGTNERITLPLAVGRNLLQLSVDGIIGGKASTDSDRLTFVVP